MRIDDSPAAGSDGMTKYQIMRALAKLREPPPERTLEDIRSAIRDLTSLASYVQRYHPSRTELPYLIARLRRHAQTAYQQQYQLEQELAKLKSR